MREEVHRLVLAMHLPPLLTAPDKLQGKMRSLDEEDLGEFRGTLPRRSSD